MAAHRYSLRVFAAQSFAGKWATFQRLKGNRWISVKRVRLQKNSTNILPTAISSDSNTRPRVRAILPEDAYGSRPASETRLSVSHDDSWKQSAATTDAAATETA